MIEPFLKWAGGKRWLVYHHSEWFCHNAKRYLEPFLGSGAVFFRTEPKIGILSDLNADLILTYRALRDFPGEVWRTLKIHQRNHSANYYYQVRNARCRSVITSAARFIYLNRTCFNGLYRVNLQGNFNVPKGTKSSVVIPTDDFFRVSQLLKPTSLIACDFSETIAKANEGDFIYVDPPYTVRHNTNNFLKYNEQIFSWRDQQRLARDLDLAASRGASILISNADHPSIHGLYSAKYWQHFSVQRYSKLASSSSNRKLTTELVISNYLTEKGEHDDPRY